MVHADNLDRWLILATPNGGLPGSDASDDGGSAANKDIYGTKDAGRRFYLKFRKTALDFGMRECKTMNSLYYVANDKGQIVLLIAAHVDDVVKVCVPEYEHILDKFFSHLEV